MEIMKQSHWDSIRKLVCWSLMELEGKPMVVLPDVYSWYVTPMQLHQLAVSIQFELDLSETIRKTKEALDNAVSQLQYGHEAAAAVVVESPTKEAVTSLEDALRKVSAHVAQDQKSKAGFKIVKNVADVLDEQLAQA